MVIFTLPVLLSVICIEVLTRNIPNDYSYKKKYLDRNAKNIEVLILGSSTTYFGIDPQFIKLKTFNAAHVAQSLNFDLEILKKYKSQLNSLRYIVVPVDYASLYYRLEKSPEAIREKNYEIYYGINRGNIFQINMGLLDENVNTPLRLYQYYFKKRSDISCSALGWGTKFNSKNNKDLISTGEKAAKRHFALFKGQNFNENIADLKEMIRFASAAKIKIIFFTAPVYKSYVEKMEIDKMNNTINYLGALADSNPSTKYYNLLTDNSFNASDFYDANHVNEMGARKLSLKIDSLLNLQIFTRLAVE